jgi:serine protease Do
VSARLARLVRLVLAAGVAVALAACAPPLPGMTHLGPDEVFEAVRPAVVIVEADNSVTWSVPQPMLTPQKEQQLRDRVVAMVRAGQVPNTEAAIGQAAVGLLVQSPDSWFSQGAGRHRQTDSVFSLGTGFFVTQDGYLLTNDHVVETSSDEVRQQLLDSLQRQSGDARQLADFQTEMSKGLGVPVSDADAGRLFQWTVGVFRSDLRVESIRPTYRVGFGSMTAGEVQAKGLPVQLVAHGQTTPGRDVALLRAPGGPFLSLGLAPATPPDGAAVDVVGYPCRCSGSTAFDPAHRLNPVLTSGSVRGLLPMAGGWSALATDASIEHGNSGGPVLDDRGQVVGLATFADAAAAAGRGVPRSFAVPSAVALELAGQARVRLAQGQLGQDYQRAVGDFRQDRYRSALPAFERAAGAATRDPSVQDHLDRSEQAIAAGRDRTLLVPEGLAPLTLGAGAVLLAGGLGLVLLRRRRRSDVW